VILLPDSAVRLLPDGAVVICLMVRWFCFLFVRWEGKIVLLKICLTKATTGGNRTSFSFLYSRDRDTRHVVTLAPIGVVG
jgi:hypothetical protein